MSDSVIFDQLSFIKRGIDVGVPREHAEWLAKEQLHILETNIATKTDIADVHHAIELLRKDTTAATELLRKDTTALVLETKFALIKWIGGMTLTTILAFIGIAAVFIK